MLLHDVEGLAEALGDGGTSRLAVGRRPSTIHTARRAEVGAAFSLVRYAAAGVADVPVAARKRWETIPHIS